MSRPHVLAIAALLSVAAPTLAHAQHALPVEALSFDGLHVASVRAPDTEALPVRVVLANEQSAQFRLDVWVTSSSADATALLAARLDTLSTLGLSPRAGFGRAHAFATTTTGATGLVALTIENVVLVVRAIDASDAAPLAAHLVAAVLASSPPALSAPVLPGAAQDVVTVEEPAGSLDFLVTCDGACEARRIDHGFRVARTSAGSEELAIHVVDAFLRAQHVRSTR
jgi:hypothetical protein